MEFTICMPIVYMSWYLIYEFNCCRSWDVWGKSKFLGCNSYQIWDKYSCRPLGQVYDWTQALSLIIWCIQKSVSVLWQSMTMMCVVTVFLRTRPDCGKYILHVPVGTVYTINGWHAVNSADMKFTGTLICDPIVCWSNIMKYMYISILCHLDTVLALVSWKCKPDHLKYTQVTTYWWCYLKM